MADRTKSSFSPKQDVHEEEEIEIEVENRTTQPLPPGLYVVAAGVVVYLLRRTETSDWMCLFPFQTTVSLDALHAPSLVRPVSWGPEVGDWAVVSSEDVPLLVRTQDLSVFVEEPEVQS